MDMNKVSAYSAAVFDRIKSAAKNATVTAVSATVNAVGAVGALVGNPLTKDYEVGKHVASFGPNLTWKIYEGKKKTTGQEVSLFVFEKRFLDSVDKRDRETVMEVMKKGPTQLTRLRHPRLLLVQHQLEESKDCLAFATEPVFASLANVLGSQQNVPSPPPPELRSFELYDVERIYGLYQLVEGLIFLHNDAKILQGSLSPELIVLTKKGQWKISGLFFSSVPTVIDGQSAYSAGQWEPRLWPWAQPDLNYSAPEYILSRSCDVSSDMYSLGVLMYSVYNKGKPPFDCDSNLTTFKRNVEQMSRNSTTPLGSVPRDVQEQVRALLSITPALRPDAHQLSKIPFFENVAAMTLQYLDSLAQRDEMAKSQFFRGLYKVMSKLPKRVVVQRILPQLCAEFNNHQMIPFVLPNVLLIAEDCTNDEFTSIILPELKPVFKIQEPVQIMIIFMQKMDLLLTKTPNEDVKNDVLPMIFRAMEAPSQQIQEMVLNVIPTFANMIEYASMKHSVIPRLKNLCLNTSSLAVRVNSLVCVGKILEHLDKFTVLEDIVPLVMQIPSREAPTLMAILGIFKQVMMHKKLGLDKDYLASKAIPYLFPLSVEPSLNLSQFNQYMNLLNEMVTRVQTEHKTKLEQLNKMQEQTNSSLKFVQEVNEAKAVDDMMGKIEQLFAGSSSLDPKEKDTSSGSSSVGSSSASSSTRSSEFNKMFGLPTNAEGSSPRAPSLNGDLLGVPEVSKQSMLQPSPSKTTNAGKGGSSLASSQSSSKSLNSGPSYSSIPQTTRPLYTSSSGLAPSANLSGASGLNPAGMRGAGATSGSFGTNSLMSGGFNMNQSMSSSLSTGSSLPGSLGGGPRMQGSFNAGPTMQGPFNQGPAATSSWSSSTISSGQGRGTSGSSSLDQLYAPELGHLQNKSKPSLSQMNSQVRPTGQMNSGMMGMRPMAPQQFGASSGMMTSQTSGMFPMQQQTPTHGGLGPQYQSQPSSASSNSNDLRDIFG